MAGGRSAFIFVSHQHEDEAVAAWLSARLDQDFLGMAPAFVSSDRVSIRAGDRWFNVIREQLNDCSVLLILCTAESVLQPWVNFEFGAAWALGKVVVPVCHGGFTPDRLGMPFSEAQGVDLMTAVGLEALYGAIATVLGSHVPSVNFDDLTADVPNVAALVPDSTSPPTTQPLATDEKQVKQRIHTSLTTREPWRTVRRVAVEAGTSEEEALRLLRADDRVVFASDKRGRALVGLQSRVQLP